MHLETDDIHPSESSHMQPTTNGNGSTSPLCAAAGRGHVAVVELLLGEEGVAVNQESNQIDIWNLHGTFFELCPFQE